MNMHYLLPDNQLIIGLLVGAFVLVILLAGIGKVPFRYNLRNLMVRWLTTGLTGLAFVLVVFVLVLMLSFVRGMTELTENTGNPANVMILAEGSTDETFSRLPPSVSVVELPSDVKRHIKKTDSNEFMVSMEMYVIVNQEIKNPKSGGPQHRFVQMRGIRDVGIAAAVHDLELLSGEWFSESGVREVEIHEDGQTKKLPVKECVMGEGVAGVIGDDYLGRPLEPGDIVPIGPHRWYVTGIMKSDGSSYGSEVWARDTIVGETFGRTNSYSVFVARAARDNANLAKLAAEALKQSKVGGMALQSYTETEYYKNLGETSRAFLIAIIIVAVFMAVGGILGAMNTMFAAINQRAKDIGVLRLLGYTRWQILLSFLFESVMIGVIGGLLGCALAYLCNGISVTSVISSGQGGGGKTVVLRLLVDGNILAVGILFAIGIGFIGGLIPAIWAMRLRPLESLR